jgi:hypothetical protein
MDWVEYSLEGLDDSLLWVLKDWSGGRKVRNVEDAFELAKLYPVWYEASKKRVFIFKDGQRILIKPNNNRAFNRRYYAWLKYLEIPKGRWVLITLTLNRSISKQDAWANINSWTSSFLKRMRDYLRKVKKASRFSYLWVVEPHRDGYPHVHILALFPFVDIERIYAWWKSESGQLSAFQGVDVEFIGSSENVREYVVKYLVKGHNRYWDFQKLPDGRVRVRSATLWMWYFRVKLFGMSRDIRRLKKRASGVEFVGFTSLGRVWELFYRPFGVSESVFWSGFIDMGGIERSSDWLPYLLGYPVGWY